MTKTAHVADTHPQPDGQKGKKDLGMESRMKVSDTEKRHLHGNPVDNGLKQAENPSTGCNHYFEDLKRRRPRRSAG